MTHTSDAEVRKELKQRAPQESSSIDEMKFGEIKNSLVFQTWSLGKSHGLTDLYRIEESVREDVELLKASPLIDKDVQIVGLKFDIKTGLLEKVD